MKSPSLLIVLSGPSGAGKGTLSKLLLKEIPNLFCSISATTRPKREGEVAGVNYYFISEEKFVDMKEKGEFLEWAKVYDNYYGTPIKNVEEQLSKGKDILLEIDIQGALQVKKRFSKGVFIFIIPPSIDELKRRIMERGTDSQEVINKRMSCVRDELCYVSEYDYVVVNDNLKAAFKKLKAIITAEKCRPQRQKIIIE